MKEVCETVRKRVRSSEEVNKLINRLNRIEGQVRGVRGMIENEAYCIDVLTQVCAIESALSSFAKELLENHIRTCVCNGIRAGNTDTVDELIKLISRMVR